MRKGFERKHACIYARLERRANVKQRIKLALRRLALRWMRKLVDVADDRLHAAEVRLREELQALRAVSAPHDTTEPLTRPESLVRQGQRAKPQELPASAVATRRIPEQERQMPAVAVGDRPAFAQTFSQWEARRSGVEPITKKASRRRRGLTAAAFDRKFA